MDVVKAFTFFTEDDRWLTKLGIAVLVVLLSLLIVPIPLLIGYQVAVARNVMRGEARPLPEWDDLGKYFVDGLYIIIAQFIYSLPATILLCIGLGVTVLPAMSGGNENAMGALAGAMIATWSVVGCLALLFYIFLIFVLPAVYVQYARTDSLGALFRFGEVIAIARENLGDIAISVVAILAASLIVSILSATVCGGIIAAAWLAVGTGHLYGQIAAKAGGKAAAYTAA